MANVTRRSLVDSPKEDDTESINDLEYRIEEAEEALSGSDDVSDDSSPLAMASLICKIWSIMGKSRSDLKLQLQLQFLGPQ